MSTLRLLVALAICAAATHPSAAAAEPAVATIASYPHGAFLENLTETADGRLLFTSYLDQRILAWRGEGDPAPFVALDTHPVGVLALDGGDVVVTAHGKPFTGGPAFLSTNEILVLGGDGAIRRRVAAPEARFLNGLVALNAGVVLAADSVAGRIWRFDPASGALGPWLDDPLLAPDPARPALPGANGLKLRGGELYVSNSSRGALFKLKLDGDRPGGPLRTVAETGPVDDFAFLPDGAIAATTHGDRLLRIAPDGSISALMQSGCDGCTSVLVRGRRLIVLTTGRLLEGGTEPARVLGVDLP